MDRQNLTLLTDLYELTMMQGYFKNKEENRTVIFDAFYRTNPFGGGYAIMCGVEQLVRYVKDLHFSSQDLRERPAFQQPGHRISSQSEYL